MKHTIKKWGRLEQSQQNINYNFGGILQGLGSVASVLPIPGAQLIGTGLNIIGGMAGNAKQKKLQEEQDNQQRLNDMQMKMNSLPKSGAGLAVSPFATGGYLTSQLLAKSGIHIKPSKIGSLHTALGVKQGDKIPVSKLQVHENDSEALRKKKQFALNARKWKHEDGGYTDNENNSFSVVAKNGLRIEPEPKPKNPKQPKYGLSQQSKEDKDFMDFVISQKGDINDVKFQNKLRAIYDSQKTKPNVTGNAKGLPKGEENKEDNEMQWYPNPASVSRYKQLVDSGRVDEANQIVFGHYGGSKYGGSYSSAMAEAEKLGEVTSIRYSDLANLPTHPKFRNKLPKDYQAIIENVGINKKANGGYLTTRNIAKPSNPYMKQVQLAKGGFANPLNTQYNGLVNYNSGGTHNQNPLGGIPLGKSKSGKQNTVEQGETSFKFKEGKYIFSDRLKLKK